MARWRPPNPLVRLSLLLAAILLYLSYNFSGSWGNFALNWRQFESLPASPKITIIAIWNPGEKPASYLPLFFASAKANPLIELLFIEVDTHNSGRCHETIPHGASNIIELCLSLEEYASLHADFLCNLWGCEGNDRVLIMDKLHETIPRDDLNSDFRPFRSAIFDKWMSPNTKIWGWCDMDVMFGNFERSFPWDVAQDFDIIVPHPYALYPEDAVLLYMRGHLTFFRRSPELTAKFLEFPAFKNLESWLELSFDRGPEEVAYSTFAFYDSDLTYLFYPGLCDTERFVAGPGHGVFGFERGNKQLLDVSWTANESTNSAFRSSINAMLDQHEKGWRPKPTFSSRTVEYPVELRNGAWDGFIWYNIKYAVDFLTDHTKISGHGRRYIARRKPRGTVYDIEDPDLQEIKISPNMVTEFNYFHFQFQKGNHWFKAFSELESRSMSEDEVMFMDKSLGAEIWNSSGHVVFKTPP